MGWHKNKYEERRHKKREKRLRHKHAVLQERKVAKPAYERLPNGALRIKFPPAPKTVSAKEVAEVCGGKWRSKSATVCCPAHDDHTPSLSVSEAENGNSLLYCHAGCSYANIVSALVSKYGIRPARVRLRHPTLGVPFQEFDYRDAQGEVIQKICRFIKPGGKKTYRAYLPQEERWGFAPVRILYNLPQLLGAPEANVLIVEGEKTVTAAQRLFPDFVATTWPGGANADFSKVDFSPLKGRNIVIFADNDDAGKKAAIKIQGLIGGEVCAPPSHFPKGWDLADLSGKDAISKIKTQINALFKKPTSGLADIKSVADLYNKKIPALKSTVAGVFVEGVTLFAGRPKIGKSRVMLQLCVHVALGREFLGKKTEKGKALYIALEDSERRMQSRLRALPRVSKNFHYALTWPKLHEGGLAQLEHAIEELGFNVVVIDTIEKFRGNAPSRGRGKGDSYSEDYAAIGALVEIAYSKRICLVFVHHLRKTPSEDDYFDEVAGSTGLTAAPDTVFALKKKGGENHAALMGRGRDVEEVRIPMSMMNGVWELDSNVEERPVISPIKKMIIDLLKRKPGLTPSKISDRIGEKHSSIRVYVRQLTDEGTLRSENGRYYVNHE